ncbi:MAG: GTP 3',8-cyclase MoaA [Euryarchaeota archaeon]|nr:GTP 3',8-cyclase MoaA [Euryarchaeota archaeon]
MGNPLHLLLDARIMVSDKYGRQLRDLRISVTDRCNFRCRYCMPREKFGSDHAFMPRRAFLSFDEIEKVVKSCKKLGLEKVRITGGEPLLRPKLPDLIKKLSKLNLDIALTTNASLLRDHAEELSKAGLNRVTISLDALDQDIHSKMTDSNTSVEAVLDGIDAAIEFGLTPVKVNCVVQKGVNESEVKKLVDHFRNTDVIVRFIEYMDVGRTNGWQLGQVIPSNDLINYLQKYFDLVPVDPISSGDVAKRWAHSDGSGEIGVISSVSSPFCGDCVRARLSANGYLHTCLFASGGHDLRAIIHNSTDIQTLTDAISAIWTRRDDRYSELRSSDNAALPRIEMSYIGG